MVSAVKRKPNSSPFYSGYILTVEFVSDKTGGVLKVEDYKKAALEGKY